MTQKQAWILAGVAAAVVAIGYLATKREINATVTAGEASITYQSDFGTAGAPNAIENSHEKMMRLIESSSLAIHTYDADPDNAQP